MHWDLPHLSHNPQLALAPDLQMRLRAGAAGQQTAMVAPQQQFMTAPGGMPPQPYAHYPVQQYPAYPPHDGKY